MPTGLVHDDDAMRAGHHHAAYFLQVQLHGLGVGARQNQRGAFVACRADRAEDVG